MPKAPSTAALACPQCAGAMEVVMLEGHYGPQVQTDLCGRCNLLWLDEFESVQLSGLGWVQLLRRMQAAIADPVAPLRDRLNCPRCAAGLHSVFNRTRFGQFGELACPRCRGTLAGFSLLLAQRGVVRPLTRRDLDTLHGERRSAGCLNCGAELTREQCATPADREARCPYCQSPLLVIDMPRFLSALLTRHAEPLAEEAAQRVAWACRACGAALEPTHSAACGQCGNPVVVPSLLDLRPVLDAAEPLLRAARPRHPAAHGQRLRERRGDPRQTAFYRYLMGLRDWLFGGR